MWCINPFCSQFLVVCFNEWSGFLIIFCVTFNNCSHQTPAPQLIVSGTQKLTENPTTCVQWCANIMKFEKNNFHVQIVLTEFQIFINDLLLIFGILKIISFSIPWFIETISWSWPFLDMKFKALYFKMQKMLPRVKLLKCYGRTN